MSYQCPATQERFSNSAINGVIRVTFETQVIKPLDAGILVTHDKRFGLLQFICKDDEELSIAPAIETPKGKKSDSKRLRDIMYRLWEQGDRKLTDEQYYHSEMEKIIDHYKKKII